jgi:DNA-binding GntR family transcriptional regulator
MGQPRLSDTAYGVLRGRIISLRLPPGARLDEDELIADLGVGRTPLREAVARLCHEGLVVVMPRRATIVAPLDLGDLHQLIEARLVLESEVAARSAQRAGPAAAEHLRDTLDAAARAAAKGDTDGYLECDKRFHDAVADACGNLHLAEADKHVNMLSMRFWHLGFRMTGPPTGPDHHRRLLAAIAAGDAGAARRLTVEHIENFRSRLRAAL